MLKIKPETEADYDKCLDCTRKFWGYDCMNEFCNWLFSDYNRGSTVFAHNAAGYDSKFVLKHYLQAYGKGPDKMIRQGNRITLMKDKKYDLRFIDSYNFFLQPLKDLSETYKIDTLKGFFPHHFNTPENQNYIGSIPPAEDFGVKNMKPEAHEEFMAVV